MASRAQISNENSIYFGVRQMSTHYLKNARVDKDADGDYWLYIQSGELQAMFCITESIDLENEENGAIRRALEAWLADQDSGNGKTSGGLNTS